MSNRLPLTDREVAAASRFARESHDPAAGRHAKHIGRSGLVRVVFNGDRWNAPTDKTYRIVEESTDDFVAYVLDADGRRTDLWIAVAGPAIA